MIKKVKFLAKEARLRLTYMTNKDCIFCKLINGEIPPKFVYEDDKTVAFADINPIAETHILIVPKKHIESVERISTGDGEILVAMFSVAKKLVSDAGLDSFRLAFNGGKFQHVGHLHMHLVAGQKIEWKKL